MVTNAVISKRGKEIDLGPDLQALQKSLFLKSVLQLCCPHDPTSGLIPVGTGRVWMKGGRWTSFQKMQGMVVKLISSIPVPALVCCAGTKDL